MLGRTHIAGGVLAYGLVATILTPLSNSEIALGLTCTVLGSLIPDIDHAQSKISKSDILVGATSQAICSFTKHRGITHTPIGCVGFGLIGYFLVRAAVTYANANAAFMAAIIMFTLVHALGRRTSLEKFGGIAAIIVFIKYDAIAKILPVLPSLVLPQGYERYIGLCIFAGAVSHVLLDMFTPEGIMLLYPYRKRFHIAKIRTGSKNEVALTTICMGLIALDLATLI